MDVEGARVLPWADWSEWLELKTMLTNGEFDRARDRVAIFEMRRRSAVPVTVLTSVSLASQLNKPSDDPYTQRLGLSMAITRFVNGMTDRLQPRGEGATARSVYSLAVELGLPLILVEIRHQACHNVLPLLTTLESGACEALQWLEQFYWEPQHKNIEEQLENDLEMLKSVFSTKLSDDGSCRVENNETICAQGQADLLTKTGSNEVVVLEQLQSLSERLEERAGQRKALLTPCKSVSGAKRQRWMLCEDSEAWKSLPLGLAPGQVKVPRLPRMQNPTREGDALHEEGADDITREANGTTTGEGRSNIEPDSIHDGPAFNRPEMKSSKEDDAHVAELAAHYQDMINAHCNNDEDK